MDGFLYQPNINAMLRCYVPNPFASDPGEPDTIEETPPRIGFGPGPSGSVWFPKESRYTFLLENYSRELINKLALSHPIYSFRMPSLRFFNKDAMLQFLGSDLKNQLSATTRPDTNAPRACDLIATTVGSGGEFAYPVHVHKE